MALVLGLTGGIGCGKSSVSALLAQGGAVIIDADAIVREVQQPGGPAFQPIVDRFGSGVVAPDGTLDRPALAALVFSDPEALADLAAITHPLVGARMAERLAEEMSTDHVVVLDIPLLAESDQDRRAQMGMAGVIVVDCPADVAVERLVTKRGLPEGDARARMANQVSREERLAKADFVIDNAGSWEDLVAEVDRCWAWVASLPNS